METVFQKAINEIDSETGFRCRKVHLRTEPVVMHYHDYYELFITLSDNITHSINGREEVLYKGTLVFIRKDDVHFYKPNHNDNYSFVNLAFTEEILMQLFSFLSNGFPSKQLLDEKEPPRVTLDDVGIKKILDELDTLNTIPVEDFRRKSLGYRRLLLKIFYNYFAEYSSNRNFQQIPFWLKKFDLQMKKIENFSMSHDEIIKLSGKSREYLSRTIRRYFNTTLSNYVNNIRLNYVANSLVDTDLSITDLFYNSGFDNLSYAYVLFKRKFNTTPRIMREMCEKNEI